MDKRLIFTVTTGRSGSKYISKLLSLLPNITVEHEPKPNFSCIMRAIQTNKYMARKFWQEKKLPYIKKYGKLVYIELSHLFCKGFVEPLLELNIVPDLIILRRDPRKVASSLYGMNVIPSKSFSGLQYCLSPNDPDNITILNNWQEASDYGLCYWYVLEIEERAKKYIKLFNGFGVNIAETSIDGVKNQAGFEKLLKDIELHHLLSKDILDKYNKIKNKYVNIVKKQTVLPNKEELNGFEDSVRKNMRRNMHGNKV